MSNVQQFTTPKPLGRRAHIELVYVEAPTEEAVEKQPLLGPQLRKILVVAVSAMASVAAFMLMQAVW